MLWAYFCCSVAQRTILFWLDSKPSIHNHDLWYGQIRDPTFAICRSWNWCIGLPTLTHMNHKNSGSECARSFKQFSGNGHRPQTHPQWIEKSAPWIQCFGGCSCVHSTVLSLATTLSTGWLKLKYPTGQRAISRQPCEIFIPKFLDLYGTDPATILNFFKKLF